MTDKSCSEWLKEMAAAGFTGTFKATSAGQTYVGELKDGEVKARKVSSVEESKAQINKIFKGKK